MHSRRNIFPFVCSILVILILPACGLADGGRSQPPPSSPNRMVIYAMMTRNYDGPNGVLNIYLENKDSSNTPEQKEYGLTAILWLVIVDRPDTYTSFKVQTGRTITFHGYDIKIIRIEGKDWPELMEVEVSETEGWVL